MTLSLDLEYFDAKTFALLLVVGFLVFNVIQSIYDVYFGPLSSYPGPKLYAWTRLSEITGTAQGRNHEIMTALHSQYGPVVRIGPRELSYSGPEAWKDIYGHKKVGQPSAFRHPKHYGHSNESIISADDENGKQHTRIRRILSPAFNDRSLKDAEPLLKQWAAKLLEKLTEHAVAASKTDILKYYNCTTFDIMGDLTFGENLDMLDNSEYSSWVKAIFAGIKFGSLLGAIKRVHWIIAFLIDQILSRHKGIQKAAKEHEDYSNTRVDRRLRSTPSHPDLWTKILDKSENSQSLSMKEHYSTAGIFMIAGTETSATALSGMTYHLLQNPDTMAKLVNEIRGSFRDFADIHLDSLARLKYLSAVIQEGLRIYPPVPGALPRSTPKTGMAICGEWVPGDVTVGVHQIATCHSENYFALPNEFHPERWLGDPRFAKDQLDANEPFSTGSRNCIGKTLAYHEMRLLLATVIFHFDLELCEESNKWFEQKTYGLWEKKPLICKLHLAGTLHKRERS